MNTIYATLTTPLQQTRVDVFEEIFLVFLGLGTLVGVVVVAYTMYNAYKYRDAGEETKPDVERPVLGELPTGGQGGKKLFLSFGLSAIIVVSLIVWTYGMLLYVEDGPNPDEDAIEIDVQGQIFNWGFDYVDSDASTRHDLVVPADTTVHLNVTSTDVWHTFGISQERVKADAKPGEYSETWFIAEDLGVYDDVIECFELCGEGHSGMTGHLIVVESNLFDAAFEEDAIEELADGLRAGDLEVDSSPEEFDAYLEEIAEAEEEENDEDEADEEEGDEEDETDEETDDGDDAENGGDE